MSDSREIPPGRSSRSPPSGSIATTVDSTPTAQGPPSITIETRPHNSWTTSEAVVGLIRPNRFALGAASGTPAAAIRARATGCEGARRAIVARPLVARSGTIGVFGRTRVSGPGQNASTSARRRSRAHAPNAERSTSPVASIAPPMWTMSGSNEGRSFAAKIDARACASRALPARP
jgi:hypothetical protein